MRCAYHLPKLVDIFQKEDDRWLIGMLESVNTPLLKKHKKLLIREGRGISYFDGAQFLAP